jgi:hypothetical protein
MHLMDENSWKLTPGRSGHEKFGGFFHLQERCNELLEKYNLKKPQSCLHLVYESTSKQKEVVFQVLCLVWVVEMHRRSHCDTVINLTLLLSHGNRTMTFLSICLPGVVVNEH